MLHKFSPYIKRMSTIIKKYPIKITDDASIKIKEICKGANVNYLYFYASGGGCGGFKYNLTSNEEIDKKDIKVIYNDAIVYVDHHSEFKILGTTIDYIHKDYEKGIIEGKFQFIPQKDYATMCGCGVSFAPKNLDKV